MNKNSDNENGDRFSILNKLEDFRTCRGHFHFKICYPELAENFSFPCNEWIQTSNPVLDSITRDFKPIHLTFKSAHSDFKGLAKSERGEEETLIEDFPHQYNSRAFSVGTLKGREGKIPGPGHILVEKVVLYVNACKYLIFTCQNQDYYSIDKQNPVILGSKNEEEGSILELCSEQSWTVEPEDGGNETEIIIDMKCPRKLQEIQLVNHDGNFGTKEFSVLSSTSETGPWVKLFKGDMETGTNEV